MPTEKNFVTERIDPTYEQVVAAAEAPTHGGGTAFRTIGGITEQVIREAGYDYNYNASDKYMATSAQILNAQVKASKVKRLVEQAVERGDIIARNAAGLRLYGVPRTATVYTGREAFKRHEDRGEMLLRNSIRAGFVKQAQDTILKLHDEEFQAEYRRLCAESGIGEAEERES